MSDEYAKTVVLDHPPRRQLEEDEMSEDLSADHTRNSELVDDIPGMPLRSWLT